MTAASNIALTPPNTAESHKNGPQCGLCRGPSMLERPPLTPKYGFADSQSPTSVCSRGARLLLDRLTDSSVGVAVPRILEANGTISWSIRREPSSWPQNGRRPFRRTLAARLGAGEMVCDPACTLGKASSIGRLEQSLAVSGRVRAIVGDWMNRSFCTWKRSIYAKGPRVRISVVYVPDAQAMHIGGRVPPKNPRLWALSTANRIRYHRRHHGPISNSRIKAKYYPRESMRALRGHLRTEPRCERR